MGIKYRRSGYRIVGFLIAGIFLLAAGLQEVRGQPVYEWSEKQVTMGWNHPVFVQELEYDPITSSAFINGQWPVARDMILKISIPAIHYQRPDNRASLMGNPSIGIQKGKKSGWSYSLDVTFPVVRDVTGEAAYVSSRIAYPERDQFYHKSWSFGVGGAYRYNFYKNFKAKVSGRLQPTVYDHFRQTDWYLDYAIEIDRSMRQIHYDLSWRGSMLAAGKRGELGDAFGHLLQLGFGYKTALVDPRMHFSLPLSQELSNDVDYTLGISLTVDLSKLYWPADRGR